MVDYLSQINKDIVKDFDPSEKYLGKNVFSNVTGKNYYISDGGAIKLYPNPPILHATLGRNGCPANIVRIDEDLDSETFRKEYPNTFTGTPMMTTGEDENGQSCGAGINVFVDKMPPLITTQVGCFTTPDYKSIEADSFEKCKQIAAEKGYTFFSYNTIQNLNDTTPSDRGECFVFDDIQTTTPFVSENVSNKTYEKISLDTCTYVNKNADMSNLHLEISEDGFFTLKNNNEKVAYWMCPSALSACKYGGGVNLATMSATYGGNCATKCSISPGNYTKNVIYNINDTDTSTASITQKKWNTGDPSFYVGTTWTEFYGPDNPNNKIGPDPNIVNCDCEKDFSITYQCGDGTEFKTQNITNAEGVRVDVDCQSNFENCFSGLGISDDGDVKILQGFYGSETKVIKTLCQPTTNLVPNRNIDNSIVDAKTIIVEYDGKKYNLLRSPSTLNYGEMVYSPSGTCAFLVSDALYIMYNREILSCNNLTGNYTGVSYDEKIFAINKFTNPLFMENYGKRGYVDDNMVLHEYSAELNPTFNEILNSSVDGVALGTADTLEQCKIDCIKNNCDYMSMDGMCTYYNTINAITPSDTGKVYEKIAPISSLSDTCPFQDNYHSISTSTWEHYVKRAPMTHTTSCYVPRDDYLSKEIRDSNEATANMNKELMRQTEETNQRMDEWKKNGPPSLSHKLAQLREGFGLFAESKKLRINEQKQFIFWIFIAIILMIMTFYFMKQKKPPQIKIPE